MAWNDDRRDGGREHSSSGRGAWRPSDDRSSRTANSNTLPKRCTHKGCHNVKSLIKCRNFDPNTRQRLRNCKADCTFVHPSESEWSIASVPRSMPPPPVPSYRDYNRDRSASSRAQPSSSTSTTWDPKPATNSGSRSSGWEGDAWGSGPSISTNSGSSTFTSASSTRTATATWGSSVSASAPLTSAAPKDSSAAWGNDDWGAGPSTSATWGSSASTSKDVWKNASWGTTASTSGTTKDAGSKTKESKTQVDNLPQQTSGPATGDARTDSWSSTSRSAMKNSSGWGTDNKDAQPDVWSTAKAGHEGGHGWGTANKESQSGAKEASKDVKKSGGNGWGSATGESFVAVAGGSGSGNRTRAPAGDVEMVDDTQAVSTSGETSSKQAKAQPTPIVGSRPRNDSLTMSRQGGSGSDVWNDHIQSSASPMPKLTGANMTSQTNFASRWGRKSVDETVHSTPQQTNLEGMSTSAHITTVPQLTGDKAPKLEKSPDLEEPELPRSNSKPELTIQFPLTMSPVSETTTSPVRHEEARNTSLRTPQTSTDPTPRPKFSVSYQPMSAVSLRPGSPLMSAQSNEASIEPLSAVSSKGQDALRALAPGAQEWAKNIEILTIVVKANLVRRHLRQSKDSRRHLLGRIRRKAQTTSSVSSSMDSELERRREMAEVGYRNALDGLRGVILKERGAWWPTPRLERDETEDVSKLGRDINELERSIASRHPQLEGSMEVDHSSKEILTLSDTVEKRLAQMAPAPVNLPSYQEMRSKIDQLKDDISATMEAVANKRDELPDILEDLLNELYPPVDLSQDFSQVSLDDHVAVLYDRYETLGSSAQTHIQDFKTMRRLGAETSSLKTRLSVLRQEREDIELEYRELIQHVKALREQSNPRDSLENKLQTLLLSEGAKAQLLESLMPQLVEMATRSHQENEEYLKHRVKMMEKDVMEEEARRQSQRQARYQELLGQLANNKALVDMRLIGDRIEQIWSDIISPAPTRTSQAIRISEDPS